MTKELFLTDSYQKTAVATVESLPDPKSVVLDQSVFYPQSGGQPSDTGVLRTKDGTEYRVVLVRRNGSDLVFQLDRSGLSVGDIVEEEIDWDRRYRLMRSHTSAHVLANVLWKETGALITGNQLDLDQCRMDFSCPAFDRALLKGFEEKTNAILAMDLPINVSFEKYETAIQRPELFRLKDVLPKNLPLLRIVSIGSVDIQADGGTHVAKTMEVGRIEIVDLKNKGAENRRVYWKLL